MPSFQWPARRDESSLTDESLAALLAGALPPEDVPADLRAAVDLLAALRAGPGRDELADEASALAEFRIHAARHHGARRLGTRLGSARGQRRHGSGRLASLSGKIAAATAVIAVVVGGVATAAVIGVLPGSLQHALHDVIPVVRVRGGGGSHAPSSGRTGRGAATTPCTGRGHSHADGSAARPDGRNCVRHQHRPATRGHLKQRRHGPCAPIPWALWSAQPRPPWAPTAWPTLSAVPTRWPASDLSRCGGHWHWKRGHHRYVPWPGSPAPSPTGKPGHHHVRLPGHNAKLRPSAQPTARHTSRSAPGHSSQPMPHHSPVRT